MSQPPRSRTLPYDIFKLAVALILLVILILLRACGGPQTAAVTPPTVAPPTKAATASPLPPTAEAVAPVITSPADGAQIASALIALEGTAQPGVALDVLDGDSVVSTAEVGSAGRWSAELAPHPGDHVYTVRVVGTDLVSSPVRVTILPPPTEAPTPTATGAPSDACVAAGVFAHGYKPDKFHYVVGSCDTLSSIAVGLNIRLADLLAANPQITNPDLIYPGQVLNLP